MVGFQWDDDVAFGFTVDELEGSPDSNLVLGMLLATINAADN